MGSMLALLAVGSLPDALHAVVAENRVGADDRKFFLQGLRNQQAVNSAKPSPAARRTIEFPIFYARPV
jgi:hypothetical protein